MATATRKSTTVSLSSVVNTIASRNDVDAAKVGKRVRSYIRAHFADVQKSWPGLSKKENRDGNRYPDMPKAVASDLIDRFTK